MRRYGWVWLAGFFAWSADAVINAAYHNAAHAELALLVAIVFLIAWLFYRTQRR